MGRKVTGFTGEEEMVFNADPPVLAGASRPSQPLPRRAARTRSTRWVERHPPKGQDRPWRHSTAAAGPNRPAP